MEKAPLIEIDKRGIATAVTSEAMIMVVLAIAASTPGINTLEMIMKFFMVVGGVGISLTLFIVSATIQDGKAREKIKKDHTEKEVLRYEPVY